MKVDSASSSNGRGEWNGLPLCISIELQVSLAFIHHLNYICTYPDQLPTYLTINQSIEGCIPNPLTSTSFNIFVTKQWNSIQRIPYLWWEGKGKHMIITWYLFSAANVLHVLFDSSIHKRVWKGFIKLSISPTPVLAAEHLLYLLLPHFASKFVFLCSL